MMFTCYMCKWVLGGEPLIWWSFWGISSSVFSVVFCASSRFGLYWFPFSITFYAFYISIVHFFSFYCRLFFKITPIHTLWFSKSGCTICI